LIESRDLGGEIAMQNASAGKRPQFFALVAGWWRTWRGNPAGRAELDNCSPQELGRIAQEVGASADELRVLAGKWPESAAMLSRRLQALALDPLEIERSQRGVSNDLKKLCSLCASKGRCDFDLDTFPSHTGWREYCPNAMTLTALAAQHGAPGKNDDDR
jgi:hypothetical protein